MLRRKTGTMRLPVRAMETSNCGRVRALLKAHAAPDSFFEVVADTQAHSSSNECTIAERPGTTIGPYKLLQIIGEGGMGIVFMAEQTEPIQRMVALKIIKTGMDTRQVIARFEAERQALALSSQHAFEKGRNLATDLTVSAHALLSFSRSARR